MSAFMLLRAVGILALVFAVEARARIEIDHEFSGRYERRKPLVSPKPVPMPASVPMRAALLRVPKLYLEDAAGRSLTLAPFFRYDNAPTHAAPMPTCAKPICCYSAESATANGSCAWASIRCSGASPNRSTWSI